VEKVHSSAMRGASFKKNHISLISPQNPLTEMYGINVNHIIGKKA
jgi:hypothetical protein